MTKGISPTPLEWRFWPKVKISEGCWEWLGAKINTNYGCIWNGSNTILAHRASYELMVGPIPSGMIIDHQCRNRGCVNPSHLRLCTPSENSMNQVRGYGHSGLKGAYWDNSTNRWLSRICVNRKSKMLGRFDTKEEAHEAYRKAAIECHGKFANFGEV